MRNCLDSSPLLHRFPYNTEACDYISQCSSTKYFILPQCAMLSQYTPVTGDHMINMFYYCTGVYWPIQSFPEWGRIGSHLGPVTYPAEGVRAILSKGIVMLNVIMNNVCACVACVYTLQLYHYNDKGSHNNFVCLFCRIWHWR